MKKLLLQSLLLIVTCISSFLPATAQTIPPVQNNVYVYPNNPTSTDSVTVAYVYVSGDACPDYFLVKDSIVSNRIYVSKRNIERPGTDICAMVLTKFSTTLNLRALPENTQIYFEGVLIKTIQYPCILDRIGTVVAGSGDCSGQLYIQETTIYLSAIPRLFTLPKTTSFDPNGKMLSTLKAGDKVKFGGTEIQNDSSATSACKITGVANCYEVISTPPVGCVKDKKGMVINCGGQLFIQEYSPISSARQLYSMDKINNTMPVGLKEGDQVIFGGYLIKNDSSATGLCHKVGVATCYEVISTPPVCIMDKMGIVTEFKDNSTLVKDSLTSDIYAINNVKLEAGTLIKFKGTKIECITTPCYNIIECYQVIGILPCVMDKKGLVVEGIDGCTGQLFIHDTAFPNPNTQLYSIEKMATTNGTNQVRLKPGDIVSFGGYLLTNDSVMTVLCPIAGVATCYEVISTPPVCIMDKIGIVTEFKDNYTLVKDSLTSDIYAINNVKLEAGTLIKFKGTKIECIKAPCYNIIDCYIVISTTPPPCLLDKAGVVVAGTGSCTGQLFIEETTPYMSAIRRLYSIKDLNISNSMIPIQTGLKVGDKVKFGGYLTMNDSSKVNLCYTVGVATCYEAISTPPPVCVMDKTGVVVPGIDGCTGRLFIQDTTSPDNVPQLYDLNSIATAYNSNLTGLKAGDLVKFGGYLVNNDSTFDILCPVAGRVTCYELVSPDNIYTLSGSVYGGSELMKSGLAILYRKGDYKATTSYKINNGTFTFVNLPKGDYTVYVIPSISLYKNYLPAFYISNYLFKNADYLDLKSDITDVTINLKPYEYPTGTGKIYGNIFFETFALKDMTLVDNGLLKTGRVAIDNTAVNTPVILLNSDSEPVAWTMTDSYGNYYFENIALETYKILTETASAKGESIVSLTPDNSIANADLMLKGLQTDTGISQAEGVVLRIYPNPVSDNLIVILKAAEKVNIYNALGQLILNQSLKQDINVLDFSTINKGIYFAKIGKTTIKLIKK